MKKNRGGRKRLGEEKRNHAIKIRFNSSELEEVKRLAKSYNLDFDKRGVAGPFLRRLILNSDALENDKLPDSLSGLIFQISKIGTNINQLTKVANYKNMRSPSANLEKEIHKSNELMHEILGLLNQEFV